MGTLVLGLMLAPTFWIPLVFFFLEKKTEPASKKFELVASMFAIAFISLFALGLVVRPFYALVVLLAPHFSLFIVALLALYLQFYGALLTATLVLLFFALLSRNTKGWRWLGVSVSSAVALAIVPLYVQGRLAEDQIERAFVEMGGDCLSRQSLLASLQPLENIKSHAVMFREGEIFVWSYGKRKFVNTSEGRYQPGYVVPTSECSVRGYL